MTYYELLKAAHVLGAVVWVGGALSVQWYERRLHRRAPGDLVQQLADAEYFGTRVFIPSLAVVAVTGLGMAAERNWVIEPFMTVGLVMVILALVTGGAFLGPQAARLRAELAVGALSAARLRRFRVVSAVEDYLLVVVVVVMVVRPGS